jgi:hypothetical protein
MSAPVPVRFQEAMTELDAAARAVDLDGRMERHPYAMIAAAAGVGFVLGGGLFRPFAGRLFRSGLRLAIIPLAERLLVQLLTPSAPPGGNAT